MPRNDLSYSAPSRGDANLLTDVRQRAPRNRTITLTPEDRVMLKRKFASLSDARANFLDRTFLGDFASIVPNLPKATADLLFLDPPYNLNKRFGEITFNRISVDEYTSWLAAVLDTVLPTLKPTASVYICGDWHTSSSIFAAASDRLHVRNRITWEREKGRGARTNWKNASEDVWFCTMSEKYTFNVELVKLRRRVLAPYRSQDGAPRDWNETDTGNFRDTHPSNLWTDITIPFWSMPENTDHPTQKSEKLLAKIILASTSCGDVILDPFLGSGTSSVVASKLARHYIGVEICEEYALLAEKRLAMVSSDKSIQGYTDNVFWERNTLNTMRTEVRRASRAAGEEMTARLF